jgi:hypothetical protein
MKHAWILALLVLGCAPMEDRSGLVRRPVAPKSDSGWVRLPLDAEAQRGAAKLWLGDAEGHPVPFLRERDGLWESRALDLDRLLLGQDQAGRPTAEFLLRIPATWRIRDREHLRIELDLAGQAPWVCRAEVQRRLEGGDFLGLPRESPLHVHDLGNTAGASRALVVPWDAQHYRITLYSALGKAPTIRSLRVVAATEAGEMEADQALAPAEAKREMAPGGVERWTLKLPAEERVVGMDLNLHSPAAPLQPALSIPAEEKKGGRPAVPLPAQGLVWNLPALDSRATRLAVAPVSTDRLTLTLPSGARLKDVKILVRREVLIFPIEAGRPYFLHLGGGTKAAPGDLGALPPSRLVYARDPLKLGPAEPDPQGVPRLITFSERTRPWLPWAAGLAAAALAWYAWKLFKGGEAAEG